jgi:hypothetical protein
MPPFEHVPGHGAYDEFDAMHMRHDDPYMPHHESHDPMLDVLTPHSMQQPHHYAPYGELTHPHDFDE